MYVQIPISITKSDKIFEGKMLRSKAENQNKSQELNSNIFALRKSNTLIYELYLLFFWTKTYFLKKCSNLFAIYYYLRATL